MSVFTKENKYYTSTRFQHKTDSTIVVNCLEANYSYWGNLSNYISNKICKLGAKEIIHIGEVGTLVSPSEIYKKIYIPSAFAVGRRQEAIQMVADTPNSLGYLSERLTATHISVSTTMEETLAQRDHFERSNIDTIDIESSKIAQGIALHNRDLSKKVRFGSIHFASDYLRKRGDLNSNLMVDLSTKRKSTIGSAKDKILEEIYGVIRNHLVGTPTIASKDAVLELTDMQPT